ncbi:PepSY domain-containing protein [Streptomyces sp. NPDC096080]|uniref:PepSY domain-containing protein n=1 Tax=Streptomyces sp. NPDC096080 TaxID=3156693 RepID=UPI00331C534A
MKRNIVIAAVTTVALIGGGTATALAVSGDDGRRTPAAAKGDDGTAGRTAGAEVTAADAIGAALARTPGTAVSAERDDDDSHRGAAVWEVDVLTAGGTWHGVDVDARTGAVLRDRVEDEDGTARVRRALAGTSVSAADAARAAADRAPVTSVELDDDGSAGAWEVETRTASGAERELRVDLSTGKVTADRSADDGDRHGEDDDRHSSDDDGVHRHGGDDNDGHRHGGDDDGHRHGGADD